MRYSLGTLVLFAVSAGLLIAVYARRDSWELEIVSQDVESIKPMLTDYYKTSDHRFRAPDGVRKVAYAEAYGIYEGYYIIDDTDGTNRMLCKLKLPNGSGRFEPTGFADDDTVIFYEDLSVPKFLVFKRRYPEWWWGHLQRPEVWGAIVAALVWLVRLMRTWPVAGEAAKVYPTKS